jgi:agmatinase
MTAALVGLPTDRNSSYLRGAAKAPAEIRRALSSDAGNAFTESGLELSDSVLVDKGDLGLTESDADIATIESRIDELLQERYHVLALGGDHSITFPIVRAYATHYSQLSIVHFDAHPDMYPDFRGNPYSHASPFARILEAVDVAQLVQIGIRACTPGQRAIAQRYSVKMFSPYELDEARGSLPHGAVYVSIDLDALDPAFAPGVSHREPGGLSVRELIETLRSIPGEVVGADIVELNPNEDFRGITAGVGAKFVKELTALMERSAA